MKLLTKSLIELLTERLRLCQEIVDNKQADRNKRK